MLQARVLKRAASAALLVLCASLACGCSTLDIKSLGDPSEVFPDSRKPLQKPILSSLSSIDPSIDDPDEEFYNASEIKPIDSLAIPQDYKIGKGDLLNITVNDVMGLGVETTKQTRVTESGNITMNLLGQIHAEGLTEDELQRAIATAYKDGQIIPNALITVYVIEARARTFSALGAVGGPGEYTILKADFRLLDAMVEMHDVAVTTDVIYIIRQLSEDPGATPTAPKPAAPALPTPPSRPGNSTGIEPRGDAGFRINHPVLLQSAGGLPAPTSPPPTAPPASDTGAFQFATPTGPKETRTIRVPLNSLRNGDLKYNIVIRPHDLIVAPNPVLGEYYIAGHIQRAGVYSIPPRKITLKQAIMAANMFDGLAIPERTELIRRVGPSREAFVRVDANAIFSGNAPDIFLKGEDQILIGTNWLAPLLADLRNGFRITYGFGFLYDRNYAPQTP